jgi:histidinol-phosphate/aromatic aminotransferase/cobyric acid decarboxylase-like protein
LVIVNPNTPTGQRTPLDDRLLILDALQRLDIVIVDESFIEFSDVDRADFLSMSRSSGVGKNLLDRSRNR